MRMICIEGLDGVGKESIANALCNHLIKSGYTAHRVSFPRYEEPMGKAIKEVLSGVCGPAPELDPQLIGPLYTLDRIKFFYEYIEGLRQFDFVILDRSYFSNFMYQASKLESPQEVVNWCVKNYEWEIKSTLLDENTEAIDVVILELSDADRNKQIYTRAELDTNEINTDYLKQCEAFLENENMNALEKVALDSGIDESIIDAYFGFHVHRYTVNHQDEKDKIRAALESDARKIFIMLEEKFYI